MIEEQSIELPEGIYSNDFYETIGRVHLIETTGSLTNTEVLLVNNDEVRNSDHIITYLTSVVILQIPLMCKLDEDIIISDIVDGMVTISREIRLGQCEIIRDIDLDFIEYGKQHFDNMLLGMLQEANMKIEKYQNENDNLKPNIINEDLLEELK